VSREIGPVRIGNCSGFYGDRHSAMREMLIGGELDYVTGDYLAELTMLILARDRAKSPDRGYAKTFLTQLEECLGTALDKGVRIVANAGGLNPAGLAAAVRALADRLGLDAKVAHVEGDDLIDRAAELGFGTPLSANAYLGAWGIVDCLNAGADVVVTGRVTDASVIVGPAAAHSHRTIFTSLWPEGVRVALAGFRRAILEGTDPLERGQYHLALCRMWQDIAARLGPPDLVRLAVPGALSVDDLTAIERAAGGLGTRAAEPAG